MKSIRDRSAAKMQLKLATKPGSSKIGFNAEGANLTLPRSPSGIRRSPRS